MFTRKLVAAQSTGFPSWTDWKVDLDLLHIPSLRPRMIETCTVALTEFASRVFIQKFTKKKNRNQKKTRRCPIGNLVPYRTPSSFFSIAVFFSVNFCMQTPGSYLHHTVPMVGLPDPDLSIFPSTCTGTLVPGSFQKKIILYF